MRLPSVLFYADLTPPFVPDDLRQRAIGGSETALIQVSGRLRALGHRVWVVAHPGSKAGTYDGVEYLDVRDPVWRSLQDVDVAVIFRQLPHALRPVPGRVRMLWVHDHMGLYPEMPRGFKRWILTGAWRWAYPLLGRRAPHVVAVSEWLRRCYVDFGRWPSGSTWAIPNGVDDRWFLDGQARPQEASGSARGRYKVAYTSVPERGLRLLIERVMPAVWQELPDVELHVFSYRPLEAYRALANGTQGRVVFRGGLPQQQLAAELATFDLWLYPTDFPETSCIAALEAQAAGLPVVSSRRYALTETVEDEKTGILVAGDVGSPGYVGRFARAVVELLRDEARRKAMGRHARERVLRGFTWDRTASQWSSLLVRLAGAAPVASSP